MGLTGTDPAATTGGQPDRAPEPGPRTPSHEEDEQMDEQRTTSSGSTSTRRVYGGLYRDPTAAEQGIRRFRDSGYEGEHLGIVTRDREEAKELAEDTGAKAATGAATGAVAGGLLGGITGLLVGIGALAIPGVGPVVAGGALASAFGLGGGTAVAGAGIGAAAGGIVGALTKLGFDKDEAEYYDKGVREGRTLVTVHDDDGRAERIFDETGADRYRRSSGGTTTSRAT